MDSSRLKSNAYQNPSTENPSSNLSASRIIIAFITRRKRPSETIVMGNVSSTMKGLTKAFSNQSTIASMIADQNEVILMPSSRYAKANAIIEVTMMRIRIFMLWNFWS